MQGGGVEAEGGDFPLSREPEEGPSEGLDCKTLRS